MYDDYYNYSAHSDYSDAAERKRKELEAKQKDIADAKKDVDSYMSDNLSLFLRNSLNISDASFPKTKADGDYDEINYDKSIRAAINKARDKEIAAEIESYTNEIREIDDILLDLQRIKGKYGD